MYKNTTTQGSQGAPCFSISAEATADSGADSPGVLPIRASRKDAYGAPSRAQSWKMKWNRALPRIYGVGFRTSTQTQRALESHVRPESWSSQEQNNESNK